MVAAATADDIQTRNAQVERVRRLVARLAMREANRLGLDPEDTAQDALLRVVERFPEYDPSISRMTTWAGWRTRAAVSSAARQRDRGRRVRTLAATDDGDGDPWEMVAGPEVDPAAGMVAAELRRAVDHLPERHRELVRRVYGLDGRGGTTAAALAAERGVSGTWIGRELASAVALLREMMRADAPNGWAMGDAEAGPVAAGRAGKPVGPEDSACHAAESSVTASPPPPFN